MNVWNELRALKKDETKEEVLKKESIIRVLKERL